MTIAPPTPKVRDPLAGMPADVRDEFERCELPLQRAYRAWFPERENKAAAHRDTWPAFVAGWAARGAVIRRRARRSG